MITSTSAWKISFYDDKVEQETLHLPAGILANFLRIVELIEQFGPTIGRPHTAPLANGMFEIRVKGKEGIARAVCCTRRNRQIIVLTTAIKKGSRIHARHMDTARRRMKELQEVG